MYVPLNLILFWLFLYFFGDVMIGLIILLPAVVVVFGPELLWRALFGASMVMVWPFMLAAKCVLGPFVWATRRVRRPRGAGANGQS